MGTPPIDAARDAASRRIADKPSMVVDGDPIEQLALAYERHPDRLEAIAKGLSHVGTKNFLGSTVEGEAATANIYIAVNSHQRSIAANVWNQAAHARRAAETLRQDSKAIRSTEVENETGIAGTNR